MIFEWYRTGSGKLMVRLLFPTHVEISVAENTWKSGRLWFYWFHENPTANQLIHSMRYTLPV